MANEKISHVRVSQAFEQSLNRHVRANPQKDEPKVTAEMLQQRFDETQLAEFPRHADPQALEATLTVAEVLGETKLAV